MTSPVVQSFETDPPIVPAPRPTTGNIVEAVRLLGQALWLRPEAYAALGRVRNPFIEGLFLVTIVGLLIAVLQVIGSVLGWLNVPPIDAIKDVVTRNVLTMPFYAQLADPSNPNSRQALQAFQQTYDQIWRFAPALFGYPSPTTALLGLIITPLSRIAYWLVYGVVAHVIARALRGHASLGQTLAATALAVAPQLLNSISILPFAVAGAVVGTWTLLCQYMALRTVHGLTWERAALAAVLPGVLFRLVLVILGLLVFFLLLGVTRS